MNRKSKKKTICCSVDYDMFDDLDRMSQEVGAKKSELVRRAIQKMQNEGVDDALFMLNIVQLVQVVGDMQKEMKPEYMEQLQTLTENLMKIKGGM